MIKGNQTWTNALALGQKQPLWLFEIPDWGILIGGFQTTLIITPAGGYGIGPYGVTGYGQ